jgi:hypothetical protein
MRDPVERLLVKGKKVKQNITKSLCHHASDWSGGGGLLDLFCPALAALSLGKAAHSAPGFIEPIEA